MKKVVVITPTIGSDKLIDAIQSVNDQSYSNIKHLVVIDGPEFFNKVIRLASTSNKLQITVTPENTGANGFNGQRIYAAYPHLINADYIFFLDEDNWYDTDHVASLVETIESKQLDFAFSLRKIYDVNRTFVINDDCESLGLWPIWLAHKEPQYLIDTSSYAFTQNFIKSTAHLWHSGVWGEDRRYLSAVREHAKFDTNGKHTLCYRLGGNEKSVSAEFFVRGNEYYNNFYKGKYPWVKI